MNQTIEEVVETIGIDKIGTYADDGSYVIDLEDSDEYGVIYSKLEKAELEQMDENTLLTIHNASILYDYEGMYQFNLIADFDNGLYKLVVSEM